MNMSIFLIYIYIYIYIYRLVNGECKVCSLNDPEIQLTIKDDLKLWKNELWINDRVFTSEGIYLFKYIYKYFIHIFINILIDIRSYVHRKANYRKQGWNTIQNEKTSTNSVRQ
jgi:hypothetical protein